MWQLHCRACTHRDVEHVPCRGAGGPGAWSYICSHSLHMLVCCIGSSATGIGSICAMASCMICQGKNSGLAILCRSSVWIIFRGIFIEAMSSRLTGGDYYELLICDAARACRKRHHGFIINKTGARGTHRRRLQEVLRDWPHECCVV